MPKGLRVATGSRDLHKAMVAFLTAVKSAPMSPKQVEKHLAAISRASRLLVGWNGKVSAQVFAQCLQMQVKALPTKDLKQLLAQIDKAGATAAPLIHQLGEMVRSQCVERLTSDLNEGDVSHIPGTKDQLDRLQQKFAITLKRPSEWTYAVHAAVDLLSNYGLLKPGSTEDEMAQGRALLMELCAHFVSRGDMANNELIQLFKAIPPQEQALLLQAQKRPFLNPEISGTAPLLLKEAIAIQGKDLQDAFDGACGAFDNAVSTRDPLWVQAEKLSEVAHAWTALTAHCKSHAVVMDDNATQRIQGVRTRATQGMKLSDLGKDVLGHARLSELKGSLETLGIAHDAMAFAAEVSHRKEASTAKCVVALKEALDFLATGDLEAGLTALVTAQEKALKAMQVHEDLGSDLGSRSNVRSADGHQLFYSNLFTRLFDAYPDQQEQWFDAVNQKQVQLLASALPSVAEKKGQEGEADIVIAALGGHLANIKGTLAKRLGRQGDEIELSPHEQRHDLHLLNKRTQDAGDAITDGFVTRTKAARHQPFDGVTQEAVAHMLTAITPPEDGIDANVHLRLRLAAINTDMRRTGYVVEQEGQPDRAIDNADALLSLQPTDAQLERLARLAGIDLWKPVDAALDSTRSPVLDANGAPVQPVGHLARTTCHISRGSDGQLNLRIDRVLSKPGRTVNRLTGESTPLDANKSAVHLSLTISIAEDGSMAIAQPVSCYGALAPVRE